jgi:hypothetical protein
MYILRVCVNNSASFVKTVTTCVSDVCRNWVALDASKTKKNG